VGLDCELWSEAPQPIGVIGVVLPSVLSVVGYDEIINAQSVNPGFLDTFVPRAGAEWRPTDRLAVRGGYYYRPTILPNQAASPDPSERQNALFLDSDAHVFSAGAGYAFDDPLKLARRLSLEAAVQLAVTMPRSFNQDNTVGKLTYQTSGVTLATPISLRYEF
jgi:long-subunit fatty acid transport protein